MFRLFGVAVTLIASLSIILQTTICSNLVVVAIVIPDEERRAGFAARNYSWPIPDGKIVPNTPGWDRIMRRRIRQVEALQGQQKMDKYDAWVVTLESALVVPNFTQYGWAVTKAPADLTREIQEALRDGFSAARLEGDDPAIVGDHPASWVDLPPELVGKALHSLLPYNEAWAGVPLKPQSGYGLRIYANTSQLYMHLDKISTHVISCIYHIDHSVDAKPWPLVIEDFEGVTQKVILQNGDLLFYESTKCLHGRPVPLDGSWYTSLFLHYSPKDDWPFEEQAWAPQYAIPDHWEDVLPPSSSDYDGSSLPRLRMVDTAMIEPDCPYSWCAASDSLSATWEGVTKQGVAISSHGSEQLLNLYDASSKGGDEL